MNHYWSASVHGRTFEDIHRSGLAVADEFFDGLIPGDLEFDIDPQTEVSDFAVGLRPLNYVATVRVRWGGS